MIKCYFSTRQCSCQTCEDNQDMAWEQIHWAHVLDCRFGEYLVSH